MLRSGPKPSCMAIIRHNMGYIFLFGVLFIFMQVGFRSGRKSHQKLETGAATGVEENWIPAPNILPFVEKKKSVIDEHPIPRLMEEAEATFRKKLGGQSTSLKDAVKQYRKRYRRAPPKGFDDWWKFCEKHNVKMVDEYDGLMSDLAPFMELSGEEMRRRVRQVGELPSIDLVQVRNGSGTVINIKKEFKDSEVSARANGFLGMMIKFIKSLPDMDFPVNALAEGRVLVPWEHRVYPNMTKTDSSEGVESMLGGSFRADWGDDGTVWEAWRRTCVPDSSARRLYSSLRPAFTTQTKNHLKSKTAGPGDDFNFVKETASSMDYCSEPYAHYQQGHFFSDWRSIHALYPVLSPARAPGFLDIRIPSHYYYGSTKRYTYGWDSINLELKQVDPMEIPWDEKIDKIFWRGATTGGGSHPPGFSPQYHRHRFLRLASENSTATRDVTFADPPSSTTEFVTAEVPVGQLNDDIMDAAFVKAVSADAYPGGLTALQRDHRFGDSVPLGTHWSYKYLIDLDGMSYSGRFLAFLASDSVPIKSTVYDEFFTDWIQPWVHYIPLSPSYKEIYNIYAYFSGAPPSALETLNSTLLPEERKSVEGDKRARRIARAGKRWKQTMGRTLDLEAYVYRLCLEWARMWADDRDSMNYLG